MDIQTLLDHRLGMIAVKKGIITPAHLHHAIKEQRLSASSNNSFVPLIDILVNSGIITKSQHKDFLALTPHRELEPPPEVEETKEDSYITIAGDNLSATICYLPELTMEKIKKDLTDKNIIYGIASNYLIDKYLKAKNKSAPFEVAKGIPPQKGISDKLIYFFDTEPLKVGTLTEDGTMDWKNRGEIPMVEPEILLARIEAGTKGEPGTNIFGNSVPPLQKTTITLQWGSGTKKSEDNTECYSTVNGQPMLSSKGEICVLPILKIDGDVGIKTGHIDFDGLVDVNGTIQKGFSVTAKCLRTKQIVDSKVTVSDDILIFEGVYGSTIDNDGTIKAGHIRNSEIISLGTITVQGEIAESKIETNGKCAVKGAILASEISAKKGINSNNIGSEVASPSRLTVGIDFRAKREIGKIKKDIFNLKKGDLYERLEAENKTLTTRSEQINMELGEIAQVQDKLIVKLRNIGESQENCDETTEELEQKIKEIDDKVEELMGEDEKITEKIVGNKNIILNRGDKLEELNEKIREISKLSESDKPLAIIKASGELFSGTMIKGAHSSVTIDKSMNRAKISESKEKNPSEGGAWYMKISRL